MTTYRTDKTQAENKIQIFMDQYKKVYKELSKPILISKLTKLLKGKIDGIKIEERPTAAIIREGEKVLIKIPKHLSKTRKRIEAAHEIAHILLENSRWCEREIKEYDGLYEKDVVDYAARMMLMPNELLPTIKSLLNSRSVSREIIRVKYDFEVTANSVIERLFSDFPKNKADLAIKEIIIWEVFKDGQKNALSPIWKYSKGDEEYYIPIHKCKAKENTSAYNALSSSYSVCFEQVNIGSMVGQFVTDSAGYWWIKRGFPRRIISIYTGFNKYAKDSETVT